MVVKFANFVPKVWKTRLICELCCLELRSEIVMDCLKMYIMAHFVL